MAASILFLLFDFVFVFVHLLVLVIFVVLVIVLVLVVVVVVVAIGLLCFSYPMLASVAFALHTLTRITFINAAFPKTFLNMAFSKNPFGLHLSRGLNKTNVFASRPSLPHTFSLHTHKLCYTQKPRFVQEPCSCWASARAVCSLQDKPFPWWPVEHAEGGKQGKSLPPLSSFAFTNGMRLHGLMSDYTIFKHIIKICSG